MPEQSERDRKILSAHKKWMDRCRDGRTAALRGFYENALFYMGHQWVKFDGALRGFRTENLAAHTPQPVTNKYKAILDAINAVLCRLEPSLAFRPGSDKDDDRLTADFGQMVLSYLERTSQMADQKLRLSKALCLYNNVYAVSDFDPAGGATTFVPDWTCPAHPDVRLGPEAAQQAGGLCPEGGEPLAPSETDGEHVPQGTMTTDLVTPFAMWLDTTIARMEDQPKMTVRSLRTVEYALARWPERKDELHGKTCPHDTGMSYLQSIMRLSAAGGHGIGNTARFDDMVLLDTFYCLPDGDFPDGCLARIANEATVLEAVTPYPFHDGPEGQRGRLFLPAAHFFMDELPGAHWATGPADHLKAPQRRRNRLQARIELHEARMANGVWFIPEGMDIETPSGEEGAVIRGNTLASGGATPARIDGGRLPQTTVDQIAQIDAEMQDIGGSYDLMMGDRPKNVEGGYALSKLEEAAKGRQAASYLRWERGHAAWARHQFFIWRIFAPDTIFYQIKGEESRWRVQQIRRADLGGGVDIDVESGSALPQSLLQKRAGIEQALGQGLIDVANPIERLKVLRLMGLHDLVKERDADDEDVAREHAETIAYARQWFDAQGQPKVPPSQLPPFPVLIDAELEPHAFHFERHRVWMLSDEFRSLPEAVQSLFRMAHEMQHLLIMQQQQAAQQAAAQQAQGKPAGGPQPQPQRNNPEKAGQAGDRANERGQGYVGREERNGARQALQ